MKESQIDLTITIPILIILLFSVILLRSLVPLETGRQIVFASSGFLLYVLVSRSDYRAIGSLARPLYLASLILLILTMGLGRVTRGSLRWLTLGSVSIQPSEIVKPALILFLAGFATSHSLREPRHLARFTVMTLLPVLLVFNQPDLGSSLVLIAIGISIALAAGARAQWLAAAGVLTVVISPLVFGILKPYQQDRLRAFFNPFSDPLGSGYHVIQSVIAVGSGQLVGRGLGHGTQSQLRFLPERHTDFIFASLAEELGFVGAIVVLGCYAVILTRLIRAVDRKTDLFGNLILVGVFAMIFFQVTVNIGMNIGIIPITGITLPLLSQGGSSLMATLASLGLATSVTRSRRKRAAFEIQ